MGERRLRPSLFFCPNSRLSRSVAWPRNFRRGARYKVSMRGSRGSKIGEATAGKRKRRSREPVHPSFDFALISAARLNPGPRPLPEPGESGEARRSMAGPNDRGSQIKAAKLPAQAEGEPASVIDIESRLKAAQERLKREADVAPH